MYFWLIAALLTLGASAAVLWPFLRARPRVAADAAAHDFEVYRDQLQEVERDRRAGLVGVAEAEEARAEIGRRILRVADGGSEAGHGSDRLARIVVSAAVLIVPILGWSAYSVLGSPNLPDQRLEARLAKNPAESSLDELVARAELHLRQNPEDGHGWDVLAPIYLRLGRNEDAVVAFRNAIRLDGTSAAREGGLGEALVSSAQGVVTADAQAAFERALAIEPDDARSRFFLALGYSQEGRDGEAKALWEKMRTDLPANSPWRGAAEQEIARLAAAGKDATIASNAAPGPTGDQVQAAMEMSSEDRLAMIEGMVSQLDARLRDDPHDLDGWQRLVRSYHVLGRAAEASDALARGVEALGAGSAEAGRLVAFASELGVVQKP
jgi:cytochrome c-type biogenesis protein CcmH